MTHINIGLLAHVDAGKTTLAESILYTTGQIRKLGRVDHKDAFLDTYELERARGITIFSKQAELKLQEKEITLLDTPGHVDFSAEMERTLQILDYAVLIISGADGVQGHVKTLWKLLAEYQIPTFLFVNKMDQDGTEKDWILQELHRHLSDNCVDFTEDTSDAFYETLAMCEESLLEQFLEEGTISTGTICEMIQKRNVFPCYFGSALKLDGIEAFLSGLNTYTKEKEYPDTFGAKVYKITRDKQGNRLTHLKITGGSLKVKTELLEGEKIDQIRIYSGASFQPVQEVFAGEVCAVTGLHSTKVGDRFGCEPDQYIPLLEPVLTYEIQLPEGSDVHGTFLKLKQLEEEIPELHIVWNEHLNEIHTQVMGAVQIEILQNLIAERYGIPVEFGSGSIVYKETIETKVEGNGHYEPLRHYAEVRLLLEPGPLGSGITYEANCSEDILDRNWQRLILTHIGEKAHRGVLTGSEITDIKITLVNGRAHLKHTEGGDFRQSTYRAIRQGLKKAKSVLLEPVYEYQLEVPSEMIGRAMTDIQKMHGTFSDPEMEGDYAILKGTAPVVTMRDYQTEVIAYSKGCGRLFCNLKGYEPCHNAEEVIAQIGYDAEADMDNPTGSVFCAHGAGYLVPWNEVDAHMHTESTLKKKTIQRISTPAAPVSIDEDELKAIFERTYGPQKERKRDSSKYISAEYSTPKKVKKPSEVMEILLVDGYNIIHAWDELKELFQVNADGARNKLMDILCNYQGYKNQLLIVVFDGYKVPGNPGEVTKYHNIYVVYTKEAETADQYIEKTVPKISKKYHVTVATSDALEQMIIIGQGALRISSKELWEEIQICNQQMREEHLNKTKSTKQYLFDGLSNELSELMDDVRMGRREIE